MTSNNDNLSIDLSVLASFREIEQPDEPDFVTELIDLFLSDTTSQIKLLRVAAVANDVNELRRLAHLLKGSSGNIGAKRMATLCEALENNEQQNGIAGSLLLKLEHEFNQVSKILNAERQGYETPQPTPMINTMNILIAEDDPVSRRILQATLTNWGYAVSVTSNGTEALDLLQREDAPSLAILDIMMPGMDGLEVCRKVRESRVTNPPYIILLTAMGTKENVVRGIEAGANDYLSKPFHRDELRVRVGVGVQMLDLQRALTERVNELEAAFSQVKQLQGMLPICSYCKKIRNDQNYWQKVEGYISDHTDVEFSHGICPDCNVRVKEELAARRQQKESGDLLGGERTLGIVAATP